MKFILNSKHADKNFHAYKIYLQGKGRGGNLNGSGKKVYNWKI